MHRPNERNQVNDHPKNCTRPFDVRDRLHRGSRSSEHGRSRSATQTSTTVCGFVQLVGCRTVVHASGTNLHVAWRFSEHSLCAFRAVALNDGATFASTTF